MEKHKEGLSNNAIAKLFGMTQDTVQAVIDKAAGYSKKSESDKMEYPASPSVLPLANTEDRPLTAA